MAIRIVKSKLAKTKMMMQVDELRKFIPVTYSLSQANLKKLLTEHKMVYVKPDLGKGGVGVIRVEERGPGDYSLRKGTRTFRYASLTSLYHGILHHKRTGRYLVQKGIKLLSYKGRSFDIRVMVQKNPKGEWEVTGVIGRLAHQGKIVTNYHSGGTPIAYSRLMKNYLNTSEQEQHLERLKALGLSAAHFLKKKYPGIKELGLDIGVDSSMYPWILEVNTLPNPFIFKKLKDKSVYRKIAEYASLYGRFNKKYCPEMAKKKK